MSTLTNGYVATFLDRVAARLHSQRASPRRFRMYREAARTVRSSQQSIARLAQNGGQRALAGLHGIRPRVAADIDELVHHGHLTVLDRLRGHVSPERLLTTLPGVGSGLANRLVDQLGVETLVELDLVARNGGLAHVPGLGPNRIAALQRALDTRLRRPSANGISRPLPLYSVPRDPFQVPLKLILNVDEQFRAGAKNGALPLIIVRAANSRPRRTIPILHSEGAGWDFTAMHADTVRARRARPKGDWVVVFSQRGDLERACTVVTATQGPLAGSRVVRGRQHEQNEQTATPSWSSTQDSQAEGVPEAQGGQDSPAARPDPLALSVWDWESPAAGT